MPDAGSQSGDGLPGDGLPRGSMPGLPLPRFSLLSLLCLTAGAATLLAIARHFGPMAGLVGLLAVASVCAHVAGAVIGNRLHAKHQRRPTDGMAPPPLASDSRGGAGQPLTEEAKKHQAQPRPKRATDRDFAPQTQLSQHVPLARKPIRLAVASGAVLSALVGGTIVTLATWDQLAIGNVLFGVGSSAVIGGIVGFLSGSLYQVSRDAWREAHQPVPARPPNDSK